MSEEREELIKALRGDRNAWPPIDPKANYRTLPAALCDAAAGLVAHQETSGWRPDRAAVMAILAQRFGHHTRRASGLAADAILALPTTSQETT